MGLAVDGGVVGVGARLREDFGLDARLSRRSREHHSEHDERDRHSSGSVIEPPSLTRTVEREARQPGGKRTDRAAEQHRTERAEPRDAAGEEHGGEDLADDPARHVGEVRARGSLEKRFDPTSGKALVGGQRAHRPRDGATDHGHALP